MFFLQLTVLLLLAPDADYVSTKESVFIKVSMVIENKGVGRIQSKKGFFFAKSTNQNLGKKPKSAAGARQWPFVVGHTL